MEAFTALEERFSRTVVHRVTCVSEKEAQFLFLQASIMGQGVHVYAAVLGTHVRLKSPESHVTVYGVQSRRDGA